MLYKVIKSETSGYQHIRNRFENADSVALMHLKLTIFTIFFTMIAIENSFRVIDFWLGWQFPIPPERPNDVNFGSDYDVTFSAKKRLKLEKRRDYAPLALLQTAGCMVIMIVNNLIWMKRKKFSPTWHTFHYFVAAALLILYIPRLDFAPVMQGPKYGYTNMNMFLFQCILGMIAGLTHTH